MENKQLSFEELLCGTHLALNRQGPGSAEMTLKALSFICNLNESSQVADLGCGTGGQTMALVQNISGNITGIDMLPAFIDVLNDNARALKLEDRVKGIVGSFEELPFQTESLDLIWSEGAIDNIGFEAGLTYWHGFLKKGGYIAVSSPSWLANERPSGIEKFWTDAGSNGLETVEQQILAMQKIGFSFVAAFALPEKCWTDNYFIPREEAGKALLKKYPENESVRAFIEDDKREVELYSKYKQFYGYVFYIGEKM